MRTIERLSRMDTGFDQDHVVTLSADPSLSGYTTTQEAVLAD